MASFADMMGVPSGGTQVSYKDYVLACNEQGATPLSQDKWIAAGRPAGPPK